MLYECGRVVLDEERVGIPGVVGVECAIVELVSSGGMRCGVFVNVGVCVMDVCTLEDVAVI